jgi:hypothetical protein
LASAFNKIINPDFAFEENDDLKKIEGSIVKLDSGEEYKVIVPKSKNMLVDWGTAMSNCIGGYAYLVKEKRRTILGLAKNGAVCDFGIEINHGNVIQFKGKYNCNPDKELEDKTLKLLEDAKIVDPKENEKNALQAQLGGLRYVDNQGVEAQIIPIRRVVINNERPF